MLKHLALLTVTVLAFSGAASMPVTAQGENPPIRTTPRPATTTGVPHVQIDVVPQPDLAAALLTRVAELPDVEIRETVISLPGAKGFWLADDLELARPEAIVGGREFAHMHPDGSLHASEPGYGTRCGRGGLGDAPPLGRSTARLGGLCVDLHPGIR